ncbi:hypothetical protein QWY93_16225 [Echinicola jeungdonensis]|uniref:Outer membrane protein beta-barrel domain-containing protein n=1 Tax=Echinicola jeungdonensis TaxID=709343 RepID=A0ABV5J5F0_9BACT|nr:hypothetical protein [Echinicola jeungdonensis]MDN3670868.1 hypothetical protein [Echinicola jeungdonensis]
MISITLLVSTLVYSQDEDIFGIDTKLKTRKSESEVGNFTRGIISNISLEIAGGYGRQDNQMNFLSSTPDGYPISSLPTDSSPGNIPANETNEFNNWSYSVPIDAGVRINLFNIFTIGGGYGRAFGKMPAMTNDQYAFHFEQEKFVFEKLYGTLGLVIYDAKRRISFLKWRYRKYASQNTYMQAEKKLRMQQRYPWRFIVEGEYGTVKFSKSFDQNLSITEPYYGVGLRIERDLSEYTKLFIKPAVEMKTFNYNHPSLEEIQTIDQMVYRIQFGVSLRLPGTKRCKVAGCGVKMKHLHDGVEYRGSSIWNMQNRKIGQWYE